MTDPSSEFETLADLLRQGEIVQSLDYLIDLFRHTHQYAELFEVLKAKIRLDLGLPILYRDEPDELSIDSQRELEDRLLSACKEVGTLLLDEGNISAAWLYLQPLPDRQWIQTKIEAVQVTEENIDDLIEIAAGAWAAPEFGFRLLLNHQGTCNAITFFDTQVAMQTKPIRQQLAGQLVQHVYDELAATVAQCVVEREPTETVEGHRLSSLIQSREWLFQHGGHHMDVTHLASTVRIARICEDVETLQQALELSRYGTQLSADIQLQGEPPFAQTYRDHLIYFDALLGNNVDTAVAHFEEITAAMGTTPHPYQESGQEFFFDLLCRLGFTERAVSLATKLIQDTASEGMATRIIELAANEDDFDKIRQFFRQQNDLLSYTLSSIVHLRAQPRNTE